MSTALGALVLSLALGADVYHDAGDPYAELMLSGDMWAVWVATSGVGGEYRKAVGPWRFGIGLEYGPARWEVQTELAYSLRIERSLSQNWHVGLKHRSNCKGVCDNAVLSWADLSNDGRNTGYNWLYLRRSF